MPSRHRLLNAHLVGGFQSHKPNVLEDLQGLVRLPFGQNTGGPIVYCMQRDQRAHDNWALLTAQSLANTRKSTVAVVFCLSPHFAGGTWRQYSFMLQGLRQLEATLRQSNIPFFLLLGEAGEVLPQFCRQIQAGLVVTDFNPIEPVRSWKKKWEEALSVPIIEVDAHNIVPCWVASGKREYAAYTIRPKLQRQHSLYLTEFPVLRKQKWKRAWPENDWVAAEKKLVCNMRIKPVRWISPGEEAATTALADFVSNRLFGYAQARNLANIMKGQSDLSPYLHFGQLSAQRVALEVDAATAPKEDKEAFLEELLIRRELADNFCYYTLDYTSLREAPQWAFASLEKHRHDKRDYLYNLQQLERAETHDRLWNAAQVEMLVTGKMHGYMRMYWAKKILEWTQSPEQALEFAVFLNDTYSLDGRDPSGYSNIMWSIAGLHDRPWAERPIFGQIRFMNFSGAQRKFDVEGYITRVSELVKLEGNATYTIL